MNLNADFSERVMIHCDEIEWKASPMPGVDRRMLDRIGDEVARATTIVRYAAGSKFSSHTHTGGEEFIVLEGVFQDEHGDFPVGTYVRNPPTSSHTPRSDEGCTIFVKLWQFDLDDRNQVTIDMNKQAESSDNVALFNDAREHVSFHTWHAGDEVEMELPRGGEFFVLEGGFEEGGDKLRKHSWLRLPQGAKFQAKIGAEGAKVWIKTGHLPFAKAPRV
ncbi:cupin domain-containing protein [Lentilitoribacter sp. Alg239-R112]|uniref:cupin domain-containing protein n=1 Tax=Lentilitoribacter sp. Alg239-R112 TaxID=2305987 RepID=UPI0013A6AB99|nr:cupin domain-containing protein [Lentilitoribacter sp. Alg239-R112]